MAKFQYLSAQSYLSTDFDEFYFLLLLCPESTLKIGFEIAFFVSESAYFNERWTVFAVDSDVDDYEFPFGGESEFKDVVNLVVCYVPSFNVQLFLLSNWSQTPNPKATC